MNYKEELENLANLSHGRNNHLMAVVSAGRRAGRTDAQMRDEIVAASGTPPLTAAEVDRAIANCRVPCHILPAFRDEPPRCVWKTAARARPTPSSDVSLVRDLIAEGGGKASSRDLMACSPLTIPADPREQARLHLRLLAADDPTDLFFAGSPQMKRTRDALKTVSELDAAFADPAIPLPTNIIPNPLTGEGVPNERGELSYARAECLRCARRTVIEFDDLPLPEQAAFWRGLIGAALLHVRALVYSGKKSIHGLVEFDSTLDFKAAWQDLRASFCSSSDARERCDTAFENPIQMMRLAGAFRPDANRRQALLYAAS